MYLCTLRAGPRAGPAFYLALAALIILAAIHNTAAAQAARLPVQKLVIGSHQIQAEVAATAQARSYGLMHRAHLPPDTGMLFVFESIGKPCFWMKNTPLPLSIAFIDADGYIVNIADMTPHSMTSHCPAAPILYALEMEQGWFLQKDIQAGTRIAHLPPAD